MPDHDPAYVSLSNRASMPTDNPFLPAPGCPTVCVAGSEGPYANTRRALRSLDLSPARGKRVLLKPNVGRVAVSGSGIVTHCDVVAAAIDAFREVGSDVAVGESPIVGVNVHEAFQVAGITAVADQRDCPLIEMDARRFVRVDVPGGLAIQSLQVCPDVLEADFVVSLAVMKMHMHTGATLSVKNMKGCLWRRSKVKLHMLPPVEGRDEKPIDLAIADMAGVLRPHLAVIDGTVGMEGLGPSAGVAKPLDVVVAGADAFAADAVACRLMGISAEEVPHLRVGAEHGYGVIDQHAIQVTPDTWTDWISPFARPPENLTIEFPNITVHDSQSCSACQSTLLLFLKRYGDQIFDYFPSREDVNIAIGAGHDDLPGGTLCIGNCTSPWKAKGPFVPGCPPVGSEILGVLSGKPSVDSKDGQGEQDDEGV